MKERNSHASSRTFDGGNLTASPRAALITKPKFVVAVRSIARAVLVSLIWGINSDQADYLITASVRAVRGQTGAVGIDFSSILPSSR
jgi:hypothetical protein